MERIGTGPQSTATSQQTDQASGFAKKAGRWGLLSSLPRLDKGAGEVILDFVKKASPWKGVAASILDKVKG